MTDKNSGGTITNSDLELELAGGLIHLDAISHTFDVHKPTVPSKGNNLNTTFWDCKGNTAYNSPPASHLWLFGMHQQFHCYVPRFNYIAGLSNHVVNTFSRDFQLAWTDIFSQLLPHLLQKCG